jgi:hypothetical protein
MLNIYSENALQIHVRLQESVAVYLTTIISVDFTLLHLHLQRPLIH